MRLWARSGPRPEVLRAREVNRELDRIVAELRAAVQRVEEALPDETMTRDDDGRGRARDGGATPS